jgi:hypothetical protein
MTAGGIVGTVETLRRACYKCKKDLMGLHVPAKNSKCTINNRK